MRAIISSIKKFARRQIYAGEPEILDFELAATFALIESCNLEDRLRLQAQVERYDRVDRSPDKKKMKFIDDDDSYLLKRWPPSILFDEKKLFHVADIYLVDTDSASKKILSKAFIVNGALNGFEFKFSSGMSNVATSMKMPRILTEKNEANAKWKLFSVDLFYPLSSCQSKYKFDPAPKEE